MPISKIEKQIIIKYLHENNIPYQKGWKNFTKNVENDDAIVVDIKNVGMLQEILKFTYELNEQKLAEERILLRPAAGKHNKEYRQSFSLSACATADIMLNLTGKEFRSISATNQENIVNVGASVQIGTLDKILYEKYNLVLPTSSLIPYVTVAGLSANAGHGTGIDQPGFNGLIKAITFCLPNGELVRIDESGPEFETIRGSHLGLFGIVVNMEIKCDEAKKLKHQAIVSNIPQLLEMIESGLINKHTYVSVMYLPSGQKDEISSEQYNNVVIHCWDPVDRMTEEKDSCYELTEFNQELQIKLEEHLHITDFLKHNTQLIPDYMRHVVSSAAIGKHNLTKIIPWYEMHYQTSYPTDIDDSDYLFEFSKDGREVIEAIKNVVNTLTQFAEEKKYPVINAIYLRFISGTNGGLSTSVHQEGNYVCGFDIVSNSNIPGYQEFKKMMQDYFIEELNAKPHWGKFVPTDVDYEKIYGKNFKIFVKTLNEWYKKYNLNLKQSMLLSDFYCSVLKLSYLYQNQMDKDARIVIDPKLSHHKSNLFNSRPKIIDKSDEKQQRRGCVLL